MVPKDRSPLAGTTSRVAQGEMAVTQGRSSSVVMIPLSRGTWWLGRSDLSPRMTKPMRARDTHRSQLQRQGRVGVESETSGQWVWALSLVCDGGKGRANAKEPTTSMVEPAGDDGQLGRDLVAPVRL